MEIILGATFIALVLLIWFRTEAFIEYMRLFKLGRFFHVDEYLDIKPDEPYPQFLVENFNNFFTRLISCPLCTGVWLGIATIPVLGFFTFFPVTFFGLFLYLLIGKLF